MNKKDWVRTGSGKKPLTGEHRVVLTKDDKIEKHFTIVRTRLAGFNFFNKEMERNKKILFPKEVTYNDRDFTPTIFKLCVITNIKPEDNLEYKILEDEWYVLKEMDYKVEEQFKIPTLNNKYNTTKEIINILLKDNHIRGNIKQVVVVQNKMVIYNENTFHVVLCKNIDEAQRLHHTLHRALTKEGVEGVMFMGTAEKGYKTKMYQMIMERTGWDYVKTKRPSTRH